MKCNIPLVWVITVEKSVGVKQNPGVPPKTVQNQACFLIRFDLQSLLLCNILWQCDMPIVSPSWRRLIVTHGNCVYFSRKKRSKNNVFGFSVVIQRLQLTAGRVQRRIGQWKRFVMYGVGVKDQRWARMWSSLRSYWYFVCLFACIHVYICILCMCMSENSILWGCVCNMYVTE